MPSRYCNDPKCKDPDCEELREWIAKRDAEYLARGRKQEPKEITP